MSRKSTTLEELQAENGRLREQVAHLEQQAAEANKKHRRFFDTLMDGSVVTDIYGNIREYNPAFQQMLGYSDEDLQTMSTITITPEKWRALEHELMQTQILPRGYSDPYQKEYIRKDGTIFPVEARIYLIRDNEGQPAGMWGFAHDISEQMRQERELRIFKSLVDYALDGIGLSDAQGIFVYANPSYQAMTGHGEDMFGMPVMALYDETQIDVPAIIGEVITHGRWQGVLPFTRKDQTTFQGHASIYSIEDPEEGKSLLATIVRDITEQQRVEGELATFKTLVDNAPDGINVTTLDARLFYANKSFQRMSGYGEEAIGKTIVDLYADEPEALIAAAKQVAGEGFWSGNFTLRQPDGTLIPTACKVFSIFDAQGNPRWLAAIVRDISEQQRQEQERQELQQRIIEAQRAALRELSTPLLPLAQGVLAMPLLGTIDSNRAQQVMETLLEGVNIHQAHTAILDITGVQMVDTQVANALIHTAQAVKLLGAQVILTGIRPAMAQTLVNLGADMSGVVTRSTLESGIAYALGK